MTREYARNIIYTLSEEQFGKISELMQTFEEENNIVKEEQPEEKRVLKSRGALNKYANPEKIHLEREAFERAVIERYVEKNNLWC